jgi:hypothetical protein
MHYFSECGFTVIQILGFRLEIINRKRNPLLPQVAFPCYTPREFRIWHYAVKFNKV